MRSSALQDVAETGSSEVCFDKRHLPPPHVTPSAPVPLNRRTNTKVEEEEPEEGLVESFKNMSMKQAHYLGKSSGLGLIRTAMALKQEYSEHDTRKSPVNSSTTTYGAQLNIRRPVFWEDSAVRAFAHIHMYIVDRRYDRGFYDYILYILRRPSRSRTS